MKVLAKAGFTQSILTSPGVIPSRSSSITSRADPNGKEDYFRGNLWPNTPDILPSPLQEGGPPAFRIRAVLAATLSSVYGYL